MTCIRALSLIVLLAALTSSQSGCMELTGTGKGKPALAQPLGRDAEPEPESAAAASATPAPEPAVATSAPVPPTPDPEEEARFKAACTELLRVAKEVDDFAYDRKGRMNDAQIKEFLARCLQLVQAVEREVPRLAPACEGLGSMVYYANPTLSNTTLNDRKAGFQLGVRVFQEQMKALAAEAAPSN